MNVSLRTTRSLTSNSITSANNTKKANRAVPSILRWFFVFMMLGAFTANAQLTGTKNIPGDYATLAAAITDLNSVGVGAGGVTLNLLAGNPQTAPAGGYVIGNTGSAVLTSASSTQQIIIQGNGNIITAPAQTAGSLVDAIIKLIGADWVTISGFTLQENASNTTTTAGSNNMTEFGIALFYATTTNGCQNVTIQNNTISLNRTYQNTFGIYGNSTHSATAITSATATTTAGGNSGLKIYGNNISNVNQGIVVVGPTGGSDHNNGVDIGGTGGAQANTITNYGTTSTFSAYANVSGAINGILVRNSYNVNVSHNSITSSNGGATSGTLNGIHLPSYSNATSPTGTIDINSNTFSLRSGASSGAMNGILVAGTVGSNITLNINSNDFNNTTHTVSSSGGIACISQNGTVGTLNIQNNTFTNLSFNTTGTTYLINNNCATNTFLVSGNNISGSFTRTAAGTTYGYYNFGSPTGGTATISGNNFSNITLTGSSTFYGIRQYTTTSQIEIVNNNTVSNVSGSTSTVYGIDHGYGAVGSSVHSNTVFGLSGSSTVYGIYLGESTASLGLTCYSNNVYNLSTTGSSTVYGIYHALGANSSIYKNKIYDLSATASGGSVHGLSIVGGTTVNAFNNIIGNLTAPIANASNAIIGLNISGGSTVNVHHNTVFLNATSSGAVFGTSAFFISSNTPTVTSRNNIFVNTSTANGSTGRTVAYRRGTTTITGYSTSSNSNFYYAGTPSATNLIYYDGTNSDQTIAAFKTRMSTRDGLSFSDVVNFVSTTSSDATYLHIDPTIATPIESGSTTIASVADDFDGDVRFGQTGYAGTGTAPDIGADEFEGTGLTPCIAPTSQPTGLVLTAASATSITIDFTPSSPAADAYLVIRAASQPTDPVDGTNYTPGAALGGTVVAVGLPPFTNTGLTANTSYTYWIYALTAGSASCAGPAYLVTAPLTGTVSTLCTAPTANAATNVLPTSFTANWTAVAGATDYALDVSTSSTFASFVAGYNGLAVGNVTTYNVTGLANGTIHYYRVRAIAGCVTANSNQVTATLPLLCGVGLQQSFPSTATPAGWTLGSWVIGSTINSNAQGNPAPTIYVNLWSSLTSATFTTCSYGPLEADATFSYDYRIINYSGTMVPTPAGWGNFQVQISTNFGSTWSNLGAQVTAPSGANYITMTEDLSAYEGEYVKFRVVANWSAGDYVLSIDNINAVAPCQAPDPASGIVFDATGPGTIGGSFTASPDADGYLTVIYPAGATVTPPVDGTAYTAGTSLGLGTSIAYTTLTTFLATGLVPDTEYDFYVYAVNVLECSGGPVYSTPVMVTHSTSPCTVIPATVTVGATGDYTSIEQAFLVLSGCGITQPTVVELLADYNAAGESPMVFTPIPGASTTNTVTIRPATGAGPFTIAGNTTTPILDFNQAKYMIIDGRPGGTGTTSALNIVNNGNGLAARFYRDAQHNTLTYVGLKSFNTSNASGVVMIATAIDTTGATTANGNNFITIDNCNIDGSGVSPNGIIAFGSAAPADNKSVTISNNNIFDYYAAGSGISNYGVLLAGANAISAGSTWTISGNSFYQTASRAFNTSVTSPASFISAIGGGFIPAGSYNITGNYIGGTAPMAGGSALTITGTSPFVFSPINLVYGSADATTISGNTIANYNVTTTSTSTTSNSLIAVEPIASTAAITITNNTLGSATAPGSIVFAGGSSAVLNAINLGSNYASQTGTSANITNNTIAGISIAGSNSNSITGIFINTTTNLTLTAASTISGNTIGTSAAALINPTGGSITGISQTHASFGATISNNTISYLNHTSTGTAGQLRGISASSGPNTLSGNTISNFSSSAANTGTAGSATMIGISYTSSGAGTLSGNTVSDLVNSAEAAANITGIYFGGTAASTVSKNSVSNLYTSNVAATSVVVSGIHMNSGSATYSNNFVRLGSNAATAFSINGIRDASGTGTYVYNSVHIGGTGVGAGTSNTFALNSVTTGTRIFRNNIFSNTRTNGTGTGKHYAITVAGSAAAPSGLTLSNNNYYATGAEFGRFNSADVTNFAAWKTAVGLDVNSNSANPNFLDADGAVANLHINDAIASPLESQGTAISGITDDIDGDVRFGNTGYAGTGTGTDIGADEFEGTSALPIVSSGTFSPAGGQCTAVPHTITAVIEPGSGAITSVKLRYAYNGVAVDTLDMTNTVGNDWEAIIPVPTPGNASVTWNVFVIDANGFEVLFTGTSYADEPLAAFSASTAASINPTCSGEATELTSDLALTSPAILGAGSFSSSTSAGVTPFYGGYGGAKTQYLIRASELSAIGLSAGPIDSLGIELMNAGSTLNGLSIGMAHTTLNALTGNIEATTTVYTTATFVPTVGVRTFPVTGFVWDGTSNIIISFCYSNNTTSNTTTRIRYDESLPFASSNARYVDSKTFAEVCGYEGSTTPSGWNGSSTTTTTRPRFIISGAPIPTAYSWHDGTTEVGTTSSLTVNPTATTTYTLTMTVFGCPITSSVTVTVNPRPAAPSTVPSVQCGEGVPAAGAVGAAVGQTYRWYLTPTGGTPVEEGTAQTLETYSINTTTTFYVAIFDGTCESERTSVVAQVNAPDAVTASASAQVCLNAGLTLTANQTGSTNTYTYTWTASPETGSGITGSATGSPVMVTPTAVGTYTYTVNAADETGETPCYTNSTVTVEVVALPSVSASASPMAICAGESATLTGTTPGGAIGAGNVVVGTGTLQNSATSTGSAAYPAPFGNYYQGALNQILIRAEDLTASGMVAGDITSIAFDVATANTEPLQGFSIGIKTTSLTALPTTLQTGFTTVFSAATYTPSSLTGYNNNTIIFSSPFPWDGTSNIIIQTCFANDDYDANAVFNQSATSYVSTIVHRADATTVCTSPGAVNFSYSQRPNIRFGAQTATPGPGTLSWAWEPGSLTGDVVSVSPTTTTVYTVTGTDPATTCSNSATVTVTVNQLPPAPNGFDNSHCGDLVPFASVSSNSGAATPVFRWYDDPFAGTMLQESTSTTYLQPIAVTTTFYVAEVSAEGCEGPRVAVTENVGAADPLTADAPASVCVGAPVNLTVTQGGGDNTYQFTWTASPETGSGITGEMPGEPDALTVTPTAPGTYIYQVTGYDPDKECIATSTVSVIVNALPQITSTTATPGEICAGANVTLTAQSIPAAEGLVTLGTGVLTNSAESTTSSAYPAPFGNYYGGALNQMLIRASELTAAGVVAGNISSIAFDVATPETEPLQGFSIGIKHTSLTALTSTLESGFTTVYSNPAYTPSSTAGYAANTIVFSTPFAWDGVSNIIIQTCFANDDFTSNAVFRQSNTTFVSSIVYRADLTDVCTAPGAVNFTYSRRPNMRFNAMLGTNLTSSYDWEWNPGALAGNSVTVNPMVTTEYTVTATNTTTGCSYSVPVNVTVHPIPEAPVATNSTQCGEGVPTASVSGGAGTFKWYDAETGGTLLQTGGSTYAASINTTTSFWVSETSDFGCEGPRTEVVVTVTPPDPISAASDLNNVCPNTEIELTATQTGSNNTYTYVWTASPGAGSGITGSVAGNPALITPTLSGTYIYTVTATDEVEGCVTSASVNVTITQIPLITSATATPATICAGATVNLAATTSSITTTNITVGAGNTVASSFDGVFYYLWGGTKTQFMVRASELTALGMVAGNINSLALNISSSNDTYEGFAVSIASTGNTSMSTGFNNSVSYQQVYTNASYTPTAGINTFTFSTPYNWDGTSNIIIQFCWSNNDGGFGGNSFALVDNAGFTACAYYRNDNMTPTVMCGQTTNSGTSTNRPQFIFNGQGSAQGSGTYNWVWNPGEIMSNLATVTPTTTTTYTVTATDPVTGCVNSQDVVVTVVPLNATAMASVSTICAGASVDLDVTVTGGGPFTYSWSDGTSVIATTKTLTVNPNVTTTYTVTVTDNCSASVSSPVTVTVNPSPSAILANAGPFSICSPNTQMLSVNTNAPAPSYQWKLNGGDIPGANSSTYEATESGEYSVVVTETSTGCSTTSATASVFIRDLPLPVVITPAAGTICSNEDLELTASSSAPLTTSVGTQSTTEFEGVYRNGFGTGNFRHQLLYRASEMTAAGFTAGPITAIQFTVTSVGGGSANNYTIRMANTSATALTTSFASATFTDCYLAPTYTAVSGANLHSFSTPFVWDGTSNILIDICYNISSLGTTSTVAATTPGYTGNINLKGSAGACTATTGASTYANRPLITISGTKAADITWSPSTGLNTTTGGTVIASPDVTTTYTATATNEYGCTTSNTITIEVNPAPEVSFTGLATAYCIDAPAASLTGNIPGAGTFTGAGITDNGDGTATFNPATAGAGTHDVTYSYNDGTCTGTVTLSVTVNSLPVVSFTGLAASYCENSAAATLVGSPAGGTFSGPGITGDSFDPAVAGAGTWTIIYNYTDGNGCSNSDVQSVTVNALPAVSFSGLAATYCDNNAAVTLTSNQAGGTFSGPGITDNGNGSASFDPAAAGQGTHTITFSYTDGNGCSNSTSQQTTVGAGATVSFSGLAASYCYDVENVVTLTGSPAGGTFSGNGISGNTFTPSVTGTYDITYTYDNGSCISTSVQSVTVFEPTPVSFSGLTGPYCADAAPVTLTGSPAGGTFSGPGITGDVFDPAAAGGGTWTIIYNYVDGNGCSNSSEQLVTVTPVPFATISYVATPYCTVAGTATVSMSGTPGGVYSAPAGLDINPATGAVSLATSTPGTYTVTYYIAPFGGCSDFTTTASITVVNCAPIVTDPAVGGMDITDLGGTSQNSNTLLFGQTYKLKLPVYNLSQSDGLPTGATTITIDLGTRMDVDPAYILSSAPLSNYYSWSVATIGTHRVITGVQIMPVPADFYGMAEFNVQGTLSCTSNILATISEYVTDEDMNNNAASLQYTFPVTVSAVPTNTTCNGAANGTITVTSSPGTTLSIRNASNVEVSTSAVTTGLPAGTYIVIASATGDAPLNNICTKTTTVTILEPAALTVSTTGTDVLCHGSSTGTATASASGGTAPYSYSWNTVPVQNTITATGLAAGTYTVTVTDANGCTSTQTHTVVEPAASISLATAVTNVSCFGGSNGTASVSPAGGTPGYTYLWSNGATTASISGLAEGIYSVTVTDANGCTNNTSVTITQPATPVSGAITGTTGNVCHGGTNGTISVAGSGGTPGYTYSITGPTVNTTGLTTGVFTGLAAGNYQVFVTDNNGCISPSLNATVTEPAGVNPDLSLGSDYTSNFFFSNGAENTILYNVSEIGGNPAVGDTIRITKVAGYTITFDNLATTATIGFIPYAVNNTQWKVDNSHPAFMSIIKTDPGNPTAPGTIGCGQTERVVVKITRNSPNVSVFTLSARLRQANSEVNLTNNLNSIVFTAE